MQKIAIIGARGLLGTDLIKEGLKRSLPIIRCSSSTDDLKNYALIDVRNYESVNFFLNQWRPDVVINCSAYTKVDDAEDHYQECFLLNSYGPEVLASACKKHGVYLVHVSTDYVFGANYQVGQEMIPYLENQNCAPCGIYGWSKYFGEKAILSNLAGSSLIVRTSWLHGTTGPNFIKTILRLSKEMDIIKVVNDQFGSLTYAPWLASAIYDLIEKKISGIIHACASDVTNWYEIARRVVEKCKVSCQIETQTTKESARKAPRPYFSKMDTSALRNILGKEIPTNEEFINLYLADMKSLSQSALM